MHIPEHLKLIRTKEKGRGIITNKDISKGEVVLALKGVLKKRSKASPMAIQIDREMYIDDLYPGDCVNHSCNPNMKIDFNSLNFIALRNIAKGEEITWNYLTTEYDMAWDDLDFNCKCGSKTCLSEIEGFRYLTKEQKLKLKPLLSPYLRKKAELIPLAIEVKVKQRKQI